MINNGEIPISGAGNSTKGRGLYFSEAKGQALFHAKKGTTPLVGKWSLDVSGRVLNFKDAAPLRSIGDIEIGVPGTENSYMGPGLQARNRRHALRAVACGNRKSAQIRSLGHRLRSCGYG